MAKAARARDLKIRPLTPARVDDVRTITASTWGSQCFDLWWRFAKPLAEVFRDVSRDAVMPDDASSKERKERQRRAVLAKLSRRRHAPVLVAYDEDEPVGFVSLGP